MELPESPEYYVLLEPVQKESTPLHSTHPKHKLSDRLCRNAGMKAFGFESSPKILYPNTVAFFRIPTYPGRMPFVRMPFSRRWLIPILFNVIACVCASAAAPRDNPYDVLGRVFAPFWRVLLSSGREVKPSAMTMTLRMTAVTGRLSKEFQGAILYAWVQFPDKLKLEAPVLGESATVCRDGDGVWATPGKKVEFLLSKFEKIGQGLPEDLPIPKTPLPLPITEKQAVFLPALPALFTIQQADVAEIIPLNGEDNRLITGSLMQELAQAIHAEDFVARLWVADGYVPRRLEIARRDFTCTVDITELKFTSGLPKETWQIPAGTTDVYRTTARKLQAILFVVMNSLQAKKSVQPIGAPLPSPSTLSNFPPGAALYSGIPPYSMNTQL